MFRNKSKRPPRVLIEPLETEFNSFVNRFSSVLRDLGATTVAYSPNLRALIASDMVILHWPYLFMGEHSRRRALLQLAKFRLARILGMRLVWVAHNVAQHDGRAKHRYVTERFVASLDAIVYLSETSREIVRQTYRVAPHTREVVTVHGRYDGTTPVIPYTPPAVGSAVGLTTIGLIRRYKNLEELVDAAAALDPRDVSITITGKRHDADYTAELAVKIRGSSGVKLDARENLLSETAIESAIDQAHGIVLPYRDILNSGSAIHALSRNRPVLVPALGSLPELRAQVGTDWVMLYEGVLTSEVLIRFAEHVRGLAPGSAPDLSALSWESVERDLEALLSTIN